MDSTRPMNYFANKRIFQWVSMPSFVSLVIFSEFLVRFCFNMQHFSHKFILKNKNNSRYMFLNGHTRKKIQWGTIKTIECLCLGTIGLIVAPWKFDVLKTSIFALEASLLAQIFVLRTSNFRGATISRQFLDRNTLLFKYPRPRKMPGWIIPVR